MKHLKVLAGLILFLLCSVWGEVALVDNTYKIWRASGTNPGNWAKIPSNKQVKAVSYASNDYLWALEKGTGKVYVIDALDIWTCFGQPTGDGIDICAQNHPVSSAYYLDGQGFIYRHIKDTRWEYVTRVSGAVGIAGSLDGVYAVCNNGEVCHYSHGSGLNYLASIPNGWGWDIAYDESQNALVATGWYPARSTPVGYCYNFGNSSWYIPGPNWIPSYWVDCNNNNIASIDVYSSSAQWKVFMYDNTPCYYYSGVYHIENQPVNYFFDIAVNPVKEFP